MVIDRLPSVSYFCTSAPIPGVSSPGARLTNPFADVKIHGDKLIFQPLIVTFLVDENMQNWNEIFSWIKSYGHPTEFDEYKNDSVTQNNLHASKYSDIKLLITNNKYNKAHEFTFVKAFPVDLSDVVIENQISDTQVIVATVTFEYDTYDKTA